MSKIRLSRRIRQTRPSPGLIKVAMLHDDTDLMRGVAGEEAHIGVWEAIVPVEEALDRIGHRRLRLSLGEGLDAVIRQLRRDKPDVVFHLAETAFGDTAGEARMASMLDLLKIPHTSASPESLSLCRDKYRTKIMLAASGIPTPPFGVSMDGRLPDRLPLAPWISKPTLEDGSIGVSDDAVTSNPMSLRRRVAALHRRFRQPVLIESFIEGREFNVGVVGEDVLPPVEIDFSGLPSDLPHIVAYESKWKYDTVHFKKSKILCPAPLASGALTRLVRTATDSLRALGVRGYSRVDLRMDAAGKLFVLEVNPNPDLSPIAYTAKMADVAGWGFDGLINRILTHALRRH